MPGVWKPPIWQPANSVNILNLLFCPSVEFSMIIIIIFVLLFECMQDVFLKVYLDLKSLSVGLDAVPKLQKEAYSRLRSCYFKHDHIDFLFITT